MITLEVIKEDHSKRIEEWLALGNEVKQITKNTNTHMKALLPPIPKATKKKTKLPKMSNEDIEIVNNWCKVKRGRITALAEHIGVSTTTVDAIRNGKASCVPSRLNAIMNFIETNND